MRPKIVTQRLNIKFKLKLCDTNIYTLQHSLFGLEPSYQTIILGLFLVTIFPYPVVCEIRFFFTLIRIAIKSVFSGDKNIIEIIQHNIVIIIEYKLSSLMICASKLQVNVARFCFQKVLFCVEIIYINYNYSKHLKHFEETLEMLKIVFPNRITNLSEKKLNKFNSHLTYKKCIKKQNWSTG